MRRREGVSGRYKPAAVWSLLSVLFLFCSCEATGWQDTRRPIEDEGALRVNVRVRLDWTRAGLKPTPDGRILASVWFFPDSGERPYVLTTDETLDSIPLPPGNYRILAFNGLLEYTPTREEQTSSSFRNIGFRGVDRYETFEAFCRTPQVFSSARYSRAEDDPSTPMYPPEALAADHYRDDDAGDLFTVTMDMVDRGDRPELDFTPLRLTITLQLTVHVDNLISASAGDGNTASVSGLAGSVLLASGEKGTTPVTHYFTLNNPQYDDALERNGTLSGGCFTFGRREEATDNRLNLYFTLRNGVFYDAPEHDVTGKFESSSDEEGYPILRLYEEGYSLPDAQEPEDASSFDPDMNDWGDGPDVPPIDI